MIYSLRRGSTTPTVDDLNLYELGWETTDKRLYIRDNGNIVRLNTQVTLNGVINTDPSLYAPQYIMSNKVLKTKASWTLGQDPFEYISIDGTVTEDSTNLISSGAVSSALTTLQSTINEALNNKSDIGHIHVIDDVTNLRTELNEKLPASLDIPIAELTNHTLREVYEGGNLSNLNFAFNSYIGYSNNISWILNNNYYIRYEQKITSTTFDGLYGLNRINLSDGTVAVYNNQSLLETEEFAQFIGIRTSSTTQLLPITFYGTSTGLISNEIRNAYVINQTFYGISTLTVERMDYWFNVYKTLKDIESIKDKVNTSTIYIQSENPGEPATTDSVWLHF